MATSQFTLDIPLSASLPYQAFPKDGWKNARCELLGVTGIGKTKKIAVKSLKDQIILLFEGAIEDRNFAALLRGLGFKRTLRAGVTIWETSRAVSKKFADQERLKFDAMLKPKLEFADDNGLEGEYRKLNPVVITAATPAGHAGRVSS